MMMKVHHKHLTMREQRDVGYWERNMLALVLADGWYFDDIDSPAGTYTDPDRTVKVPRYHGWRRVLSLFGGRACFHIPDDFEVGPLSRIEPNWNGHTTPEKWHWIAAELGIELEEPML